MTKRLLLAALLGAATVPAMAATYTIDPTHSQVVFVYSHFGFSNITGRFDTFEGTFEFDPADPAASRIDVQIPIASITTGVEKLDQHLQAADFFNVAEFPAARFVSTKVTAAGENALTLDGDLTIRGVTKPTTFNVTINKIGEHPMRKLPAAGFDATATIKRSDFGLGLYAPAVGDEVKLSLTVEAAQVPAAE